MEALLKGRTGRKESEVALVDVMRKCVCAGSYVFTSNDIPCIYMCNCMHLEVSVDQHVLHCLVVDG